MVRHKEELEAQSKKYTKEQAITVLKEAEAGAKVADLC
jgi:hypothetical protein